MESRLITSDVSANFLSGDRLPSRRSHSFGIEADNFSVLVNFLSGGRLLRRRGGSFRIEADNYFLSGGRVLRRRGQCWRGGSRQGSASARPPPCLGVEADVGEEDLDKVQPLLGLLHVGHCSHPGPVTERNIHKT